MTIADYLCQLLGCGPALTLVPHLSEITEQRGRVAPAPTKQGNPQGRMLMSFTMTDTQQVTLTIAATDKKGNPATLPTGSVQWSVDLPTVVGLTPSADGLSCLAVAVGPLGSAIVTCKVVDAGGNALASGTLGITIVGSGATNIVVIPGTPAEQP